MVRDPIACIPSTLRMVEITWKGKKWRKDQYADAQAALTQISFDSFKLPAQVLSERPDTPQIIVDYRELVSSPKQTVESVYAALGIDMSQEYSNYLSGQEEKEKKHSSHYRYNIDDYAVTPEQIETELEAFYQQYQWPRVSEQQA
jgi:hypothetical protein